MTLQARWRNLGRRWRVASLLTALALVVIGGGFVYQWWISWPPRLILTGVGPMFPLAFSPDGKTLVTDDDDGLALWDVATGAQTARWYVEAGRKVFRGKFTPDGRSFGAITYNLLNRSTPLEVTLFDVATGQPRGTVALDQAGWFGDAVSSDGRTLRVVTADAKNALHVADVDLETASLIAIRPLSLPAEIAPQPVSLADGKRIAVAVTLTPPQSAITKLIWDLDNDRETQTVTAWPSSVPLAFSSDGSTLALGGGLGEVGMWDLDSKTIVETFTPHPSDFALRSVTFSPDGSRFVSQGEWGTISMSLSTVRFYVAAHLRDRSWRRPVELAAVDRRSGKILGRIPSEGRAVFSPDGRTLASCHEDGTVRLRDMPTR